MATGTYTYNPTATTANYGEHSPAVLTLQQNLNLQNKDKPGWVPLDEDAKYGPLTQAGVNWKPSSLISTSTASRREYGDLNNTYNQYLRDLNTDTGKPDQYTDMLDQMKKTSDLASKSLISTIQASRANQRNLVNEEADRYKRGLEALGMETGTSKYLPEIQAGKMSSAESSHQAKLQTIESEYLKALTDAQLAKDKGDMEIFKEKVNYARQLKQDKVDELKNYYDTIATQSKVSEFTAKYCFSYFVSFSWYFLFKRKG